MGGILSSSRRDAFTNDLRASTNDVGGVEYDDDYDGGDGWGRPCFGFCPVPVGTTNAPSSSSSRRGARSIVPPPPPPPRHRDHDDDDGESSGFGTPIPDTPDSVRRMRGEAMAKYRDDNDDDNNGEEKKSSSMGSRGGGGPRRLDPLMSSTYGGLEKEASGMGMSMLLQSQSQSRAHSLTPTQTDGSNTTRPCAEIHDGPDAESKLYRKYEMCEVLGVGSTSTCHRCVELATGESRACKIVDKSEIDPSCHSMMDQFLTEIRTLRSLQHPNIIELYDVYISEDKIYIIMELMSGGELFDYVVQKGTLTEEEASRIVRKVTSALVYMHSKNVIHRDMKPENLLLAHKPRSSHDIEVKIIDFGLSKILTDSPLATSFLGTRGYLAPEMIQRRDYTKSVDAWALGVIIFVLLCGCLPFDDDCQLIPNSPDLRTKFTLRFPRWAKDLSPSAKDLLNRLLNIDSTRRYTAEQAMDHPWVRGETASGDSLLQSPGRLKPSPGGKHGKSSSEATRVHVSQMVANRAIANAQIAANYRSPVRHHVRKSSI